MWSSHSLFSSLTVLQRSLPPFCFPPTSGPLHVLVPVPGMLFPGHEHAWLLFFSWVLVERPFPKRVPFLLLTLHTQPPVVANHSVVLSAECISQSVVVLFPVYCLPPQLEGKLCKDGDHMSFFPAVSQCQNRRYPINIYHMDRQVLAHTLGISPIFPYCPYACHSILLLELATLHLRVLAV